MWARQGSNLRPIGYEPTALPLSYGPLEARAECRSQASPPDSNVLLVYHDEIADLGSACVDTDVGRRYIRHVEELEGR